MSSSEKLIPEQNKEGCGPKDRPIKTNWYGINRDF